MVFSVVVNLPAANIIPLKQVYYTSIITSSMPSDHISYQVFAAIYITDYNILITRLSSWFGIRGFVLNLFLPTYHVVYSVSSVIKTFPNILLILVFLEALFSIGP